MSAKVEVLRKRSKTMYKWREYTTGSALFFGIMGVGTQIMDWVYSASLPSVATEATVKSPLYTQFLTAQYANMGHIDMVSYITLGCAAVAVLAQFGLRYSGALIQKNLDGIKES
jgi:hypothetical protein